jgi:hypothetical protein
MAEIELSELARQCLDRRIPDQAPLIGKPPPGKNAETRNLSRLTGNLRLKMSASNLNDFIPQSFVDKLLVKVA